MFTIYHSNQLDLLKDLLIDRIQRDPLPNPLEDEQILVQSPGMAQWLRQALAESMGIAASLNFPLPASFLWDMFVKVLPEVPRRSAFNKEAMTWKLMSLLPEMLDQEAFQALRHYLADDNDTVRCYQLAGKVADIFDQYLVYRPEWMADWEQGKDETARDQLWQPMLWRALVARTAEAGQSHWHRANMHQSFLNELENGAHQQRLPRRLFVFGISALPPHFVETLKALGQQTEVHLMVCNPCQYYWGDEKDPKYLARLAARLFSKQISKQAAPTLLEKSSPQQDDLFEPAVEDPLSLESSNALLASMGKLGRDYMHQLHGLDATEIVAFVEGQEDSLLHRIQKDILDLTDRSQQSPATVDSADHSLVFHNCHSALREVEVLHDQLLKLFEMNPDLTPRDVVVMLPDVDQYSPWIHAVFGGLPEHHSDPRYIPFAISDRSASQEFPLLKGLLQLLDLDNQRCGAQEMLELLEIPAIQRRFKIDEKGFELLRRWIDESGIRWGLSPEHQSGFGVPPRESNSWLFGLKRMLLGYALPEENGLFSGILPLDSSQGMNAVLSGQLAAFIEEASELILQLNESRSIESWTLFINQILDNFFEADEEDEYALKLVRSSLEHLTEQLRDAGYTTELSRPVLLDYLTERLTSERSSQKFLSGRVNFCTLMPMRSIPFKVVCLLGMNDGAYPRSIPPAGFDLMTETPRRGDRSRREDDRYLFLEALLSARETFYISYTGRNIKDNSERIPSVLVTELQEYCSQFFQDENSLQCLITEHRLQPFSQENFNPGSGLFSYAKEWLPAARKQTETSTPFLTSTLKQRELPEALEVPELLRFFRNPSQYFCNRRLKVYFEQEDTLLSDTEPFSMGPLDTYWLKTSLLETLMAKSSLDSFKEKLNATGTLPHGAFGELLLEDQQNAVSPLVEKLRDSTLAPLEDVEVNLSLAGIKVTGWLKQHYAFPGQNSGLLRYRAAKLKARDKLFAWIEHLLYCACQGTSKVIPGHTRLLGLDGEILFTPLPAEQAITYLDDLVALYLQGQTNPVPFFPGTSQAWLEKVEDDEKARKAAETAFYGGYMHHGEAEDPYIHRIFPELDPIYDDFTNLSRLILEPMSKTMEVMMEGSRK
ncbi:exodeoxyribonuclease V subunit gamma [Endozoicomonas numazuensis]|uniref:exodeoxyribonuclease V subunit gamma n=1 Tax=Endozoicomonas numazuensis TaxID=1137799 RepID=UPI00054F0871|nr:exodeoxyribonuclease V subunit gamma [Endozoicomonas numazuensis]